MKRLVLLLAITACGYSAKGNELVGQVKKVVDKTPLVCGDYAEADVSLGTIRNGVGSMSKEDVTLYIEHDSDIATLKKAAESGQLVKLAYDVRRVTWCVPDHWLTHAEIEQ